MSAKLRPVFVVPQAIQKTAREARAAHLRTPLPEEVSGVVVSEALVSGRIDDATLKRMRRFFTVQRRHFESVTQLQHTFDNSPLLRSWALHGGEAGRVWCERVSADGHAPADPYVALLEASPEEVYARLSLGAWRWEYDMSPAQAARFIEEYHRATGTNLDLDKAFGGGRDAVAKAMMRRAMNESPFKQLARALMRDEYRKAAQLDLRQLRESIGRPALNWPEFISFVVLGVRAPEALDEVFNAPVPLLAAVPASVFQYSAPLASYVTYFHPRGALFEAASTSPGTSVRMAKLMSDMCAGRAHEATAQQTLREARVETARGRLAAGLGHVLLEAWERSDWPVFLDALPLDSPVRGPFVAFAEAVDRAEARP